jgi:hypothetical protein
MSFSGSISNIFYKDNIFFQIKKGISKKLAPFLGGKIYRHSDVSDRTYKYS